MKTVSVIIPTYNGRDLLAKFLPSVVIACRNYPGESEIIIKDDGSDDGTEGFLKIDFPAVKIVRSSVREGFSKSCNLAVGKSRGEVIILLNTDVKVEKDFLLFIVPHFENEQVFAVRLGVKTSEADSIDLASLRSGGEFKRGFIYMPEKKAIPNHPARDLRFAFYASGGAAAVSKNKFLRLGGFSELFSPFYSEDLDLSYRAWKRGWQIIYEPKSVVYHQSGTTIFRSFSRQYIDAVSLRNKFILVWKNITDKKLLAEHLLYITIRVFRSIYKLESSTFLGLVFAITRLPRILRERYKEKREAALTDRQVFKIFEEYLSLPDFNA